jgi:hypothetical protein
VQSTPPFESFQYNQNNFKSSLYLLVGGYNLQSLPEAMLIKIML